MASTARLLLALPATTAFQLCMDITAPLENPSTPCCEANAAPDDHGQFCCSSGGINMCFLPDQQLFRRTFNSTNWQGTSTLYYREWHLGADLKPGSYYWRSMNYFAEPDHPRLNYASTEITVSPSAASPISGKAPPQPLSVTAGASELELCFGRVAPFEESKPCCHAVGTNEDGHWCCVSGSTTMCLDENTHMFWTRYNRSTTMYYHEWYVEAPTSNHEYHYTHTEAYFAEPDHPRLNYERDEIRVTPVAIRSEALV